METFIRKRNVQSVTVAIITRNEASRLPDLLRALLGGTVLPAAIMVVDNGSTDLSRQIVASFAELNPDAGIQWRGFPDNNLGRSRAFAIENAATDRVAFLDADCSILPTWLECLTDAFAFYKKRFPELAGIGANTKPLSRDPNLQRWLTLLQEHWLGHGGSPQARFYSQDAFVDHLPTTSVIFCRETVLRHGNFSENFPMVCEDVELSLRLRQNGQLLLIAHDVVVGHTTSENLVTWSERMWRFGWGQGWVQLAYPRHWNRRFWAPALAFHGFVAALVLAPAFQSILWCHWLYFAGLVATSARVATKTRRWEDFSGTLLLMLVTHFSYAGGAAYFFWQHWLPRLGANLFRSIRSVFFLSSTEAG